MREQFIKVVGAKEHNLKNINIDIPKDKLVVVTGLSGSGKSSLIFDTVYAEGQRRYIESLSVYARQFLNMQDKPDVESIEGLSPAIAIDQKTTSRNPRSTVGTVTEIYDHMRLLYARIGIPYSPATNLPIVSQSPSQIVKKILELPNKTKLYILAPIIRGEKGEHKKELLSIKKQGFQRVKIDGKVYEFKNLPHIDKNKKHDIEVVVDRIVTSDELGNRVADSVETALKISQGLLFIEIYKLPEDVKGFKHDGKNIKNGDILVFSEKFCCPESGFAISEIEPRLFSFNSPYGACKSCDGLGTELCFDPELIIADENLSLRQGAISTWSSGPKAKYYQQILVALSNIFKFNLDSPYKNLDEKIKNIILHGYNEEIEVEYEDGYKTFKVQHIFKGAIGELEHKMTEARGNLVIEELSKYQNLTECSRCDGYRLSEQSLCVKIDGLHIGELSQMSVAELAKWFEELPNKLNDSQLSISQRLLKEIDKRMSF